MKTLIFTAADVHRVVKHVGFDSLMDELIVGLTDAFRQFDAASSNAPIRGGFKYDAPNPGLLEWMPAIEFGREAVVKIVGYHPNNPELHKLPTILSVVIKFDVTSGHMVGLIDGTFLTALRTGAASAVASRILAPPSARVLGLIGAGAQAMSQLHALSRVFEFDEVLVFDTNHQTSASFAERCATLNIGTPKITVANLETVATAAHILCTVTSVPTGAGPVFRDAVLKPSLHINAVGSDFPGKVEVPASVLARSLVCPDFREQALREGECQQLDPDSIGPDIVELVKRADHYERYRDQITVFDSTGWAIEDKVASDILFRHGRELGCGTLLEVESISEDPKNPYAFAVKAEQEPRPMTSREVTAD